MPTLDSKLCWFLIGSGIFSVFLAGGCSSQPPKPQETNVAKFESIHKPFALGETRLRSLIENVGRVQIGDTRQKIEALLGEPQKDLPIGPKEINRVTGRIVEYYVTKSDPNIANNNDKVVTLIFDTDDRLVRIRSNVEGVQNRP